MVKAIRIRIFRALFIGLRRVLKNAGPQYYDKWLDSLSDKERAKVEQIVAGE